MPGKLLHMTKNGNATLSGPALTALLNAPANREGAVPQASAFALAELSAAGLIGSGGGLTRAGVIRREREHEALLDAMF